MGSQEAVASLMDLRSGIEGGSYLRSPNSQILPSRRIEDVVLLYDRIRDLFQQCVIHLVNRDHGSLTDEQLLYRPPSVSSTP